MFEQRVADTAAVRFQYAVAGDGPPAVLLPGSGRLATDLQRHDHETVGGAAGAVRARQHPCDGSRAATTHCTTTAPNRSTHC